MSGESFEFQQQNSARSNFDSIKGGTITDRQLEIAASIHQLAGSPNHTFHTALEGFRAMKEGSLASYDDAVAAVYQWEKMLAPLNQVGRSGITLSKDDYVDLRRVYDLLCKAVAQHEIYDSKGKNLFGVPTPPSDER